MCAQGSFSRGVLLASACVLTFAVLAPVTARAHGHAEDAIPVPLLQPQDERNPFGVTPPLISPMINPNGGPTPYPEPATLGLLLAAASCIRPRRTGPPRGG